MRLQPLKYEDVLAVLYFSANEMFVCPHQPAHSLRSSGTRSQFAVPTSRCTIQAYNIVL